MDLVFRPAVGIGTERTVRLVELLAEGDVEVVANLKRRLPVPVELYRAGCTRQIEVEIAFGERPRRAPAGNSR